VKIYQKPEADHRHTGTIVRRIFFLFYLNISTRIFGYNVPFPGLCGGLYGQNLPYKLKKLYGDLNKKS
jgi:hypothetical protein